MIRLFAAVGLPPDARSALARRQGGLDGARWVRPENLHVTLRFFGDLREDVAADLDAELSTIQAPAFDLHVRGVGSFGEGHEISVVWAGVEEDPVLLRLAAACETAARRAGLKPETRRYKPHITLAYLKHPDPTEVAAWIQAHNLLQSPALPVEGFGLYSSRLGGEGAHYRVERDYPLG